MTRKLPPQNKPAGKVATHVTSAGTQKYQANGPTAWAPIFKEIAEAVGGKGTPAAIGIRAALAYAVQNRASIRGAEKVVGEATTAAALVPAKKAPKAKRPKAKTEPKAPKRDNTRWNLED